MKKRIFYFVCLLFFVTSWLPLKAQQFTEAYNEVLKQKAMAEYPVAKWDSLRCAWYGECQPAVQAPPSFTSTCTLTKRMWGWHAIGTSSTSYQWPLLSDLSYFSYQVDPATGNATNPTQINAFPTDATVVAAQANGVKVTLCATLFNNGTEFATFFASSTAQNTLITNLISSVQAANAKGINIDFEGAGLSSTYLSQFTSFMSSLSSQLHAAIPNSELSMDFQGSYANSSSLINPLLSSVDIFILMGYDYYWSGQFYPGPVAPTYQFPAGAGDPNGHGNVANDLNNMLKLVPANRTILAMPYYGRRWRTTNGCVIPATGNAASISTQTYTQFRQNSNGYYSNTLRELNTYNAYHCFTDVSAIPNEQFIDDTFSLQKKYNVIFQRGIAGAAVWRLGYDAGYNDCWNLVNNNLTDCAVSPFTDTLYDMGGPNGNYHNAENYTFTIAPPGASSVTLSFLNFDLENNFDSLWVYDGTSTSSSLIGAFSNNILPSPVTAASGKMTIRFHSDNATVKTGYRAVYTSTLAPAVFRTVSSGNWNDPLIWETGTVPTASDTAVISFGNSVIVNASAQIKNFYISPSASLSIFDPGVTLTVGNGSNKIRNLQSDGSINISNGNLLLYGNLSVSVLGSLNLTGGKLIIDGNTGTQATSVADGIHLFDIQTLANGFLFSGGTLQIINPPFGANSQSVNCAYDFGNGSTLLFGDGVSTISSNNPNGFGGSLLPAHIGQLVLDAATSGNNRIFKNLVPVSVKTICDVKSGNLVQGALLQVVN